jgi:hypothetical protein
MRTLIALGKPMRTGSVKTSTTECELLNEILFFGLDYARAEIAA